MSLSKLFPCFQFRLEDNINKLDYSNNILSEGFPQVWQYERTLEELNMMSTRINYFPPQLFYCQGLKILLANNNSLESIPEAIGSLRQLQQLNLSRNFISNVPENIKSCKNLTHLDLSCNTLQKLPDALTCLISLQELILNETYLEFLPANFGRLVNLRIVELRSNNLIALPKSMQRLTNLQRLDIGCNEFTKLPEVIGELKQLRELWFDFNQIQDFPIQIGKLRELVHCDGNGNCLRYLPNEVGNWRSVEVLSISINNLTVLPFSIGMLKSLVTLKCESNELTELPDSISNLENLEELVVSHNKLTRLPNTIGMLRKLRYLFADDNNLQRLPEEICSCSVLSVLSISCNKIAALPDNIGHLTNLKVLNIVQNNIATFPVTLLSLVNLTSLWISNNQSQPLIPLQYADISKKTQLTCFMLPQSGIVQTQNYHNNYVSMEDNNDGQVEQFSDDAAISKRRIWFAEETTILHTNPEMQNLSFATSTSRSCYSDKFISSYPNLSNITATSTSNNKDLTTEDANELRASHSKDFLMRSPTPYPKELRLMAKYIHVNNGKILNNCNKQSQVIFCEENISADKNFTTLTQSKSNNVTTEPEYWSCNVFKEQPLDTINENDKYNIQIRSDDRHEHIQSSYVKQQQNQCLEIDRDFQKQTDHAATLQQLVVENIPKPPPYHIARCFTKKSVEDLTKYEFIRKRQEQNHSFQNYKGNQFCPQTDSNSKNMQTRNKQNNEHAFDFQNNLMIQKFDQNGVPSKSEAETKGAASTMTIKHYENKNRSRTKWLFGVHKNPRVIQVNINMENGRDFEIDVLPNKEGIFVVSTFSESNSFQLIQPFDKLLEVDGVDFTNISVNEARLVLDKSRSSKSIMLSRK